MRQFTSKLKELEKRAGAGTPVIGTYWQDKPDEIKAGGEVLTRQQWDNKYPDAGNIILKWGDK